MVAATALQSVAEAFERAMKDEEFDRAAELKTKALELRRAQEKAFDPIGFEKLERLKAQWQQSFGGADANVEECLTAYRALLVDEEASDKLKYRDAFLSCVRSDLAASLAPAFLELESLAL